MPGSDPKPRRLGAGLAALWLLVALAPNALAEEGGTGPAAEAKTVARPPAGPDDAFDRGVPRSAMRGYLEATREGDYERAAEYLDLRRIPRSQRAARGPRLARELKTVLDQTLWVELDALSEEPKGVADDGLPWYRDWVGEIQSESGDVPVYLDRVPRGDDVRVWKIAATTLERVPALYEAYGFGPLEQYLPQTFFVWQAFDVQLWQWVGVLLLVTVAYLVSWLLASGIVHAAGPLVSRTDTSFDDRLLEVTAPPLRLLIAIGLFSVSSYLLALALPAQRVLGGIMRTLAVLGVTWLIFRTIDVLSHWMSDRLAATGRATATHVLPMGRRAFKLLLGLLAVLAVLQNVGVNVTGLLAGLGFGGLAFALAAQRTLENLFGGITVLADQPVRVGDFCRFGDKVGTVEDIGLRSTRVRTLDRTVVTVPNAEFSTMQLENFGKRDRIWFHPKLGLRYETTPDQLRYVLVSIREMLYAHPRVDPDPARIRFVGFGDSSLDLEIFAYVRATDYGDYLEVAEDLNLRMMDIVERAGTGFAFPSQTLYVGRDDGLDAEKVRAAGEQVEAWRRAGQLNLPGFRPERIRELAGTLDYPNEGSSARARASG